MTHYTLSRSRANTKPTWESLLVLSSVTLLSTLAVFDRLAAWLIGEYPTYSVFWQLRFEFLRPIGAYYDLVAWRFGDLSPAMFTFAILLAAVLIAGGIISRMRLARAISCHTVLAAAVALAVLSSDSGSCLHIRPFGRPSELYLVMGGVLSSIAFVLCLRIHAEYLGQYRALPLMAKCAQCRIGIRRSVDALLIGLTEQWILAPRRLQAALAAAHINRYRNFNR